MPTHRMLPPALVAGQKITSQGNMQSNGRNYSGSPGAAVDVPDFDVPALSANGWVKVALSGPTGARPTAAATSAPLHRGHRIAVLRHNSFEANCFRW